MKKKRILFILPNLFAGGAERVILTFLRYLRRDIFQPSLLLIWPEGDYWNELPNDIEVCYLLEKGQKLKAHPIKVIRKLIKFARQSDIIIGALELTSTYLAYLGGILTKKPVIGWLHIDLLSVLSSPNAKKKRIQIFKCKIVYPHLSKILGVSHGVLKNLKELIPKIREEQLCVLYNPVSIDKIKQFIQEKNYYSFKKIITIVSVGRLSYQKGFDILIKAYALLKQKGFERSRLLIVGKGETELRLKALVRELDLNHNVEFLGFQPEPWKYMREADLFVLSSRYEGLPMVLIEAMLCGIPIVSTNCPFGPNEVLLDGECGLLVPPNDPEALAIGMQKVLEDEKLRMRLIKAGSRRATDFFPENIVPQLENILNNL